MSSKPFIGVGLRSPHYQDILEQKPNIDWFEGHSKNYLFDGGLAPVMLSSIRENYPQVIFLAILNPSLMSASLDSPLHITILPGGGLMFYSYILQV